MTRVPFSLADLGVTEKEEFTGISVGFKEKFKLEGVGPVCVLGVIIEENNEHLPDLASKNTGSPVTLNFRSTINNLLV